MKGRSVIGSLTAREECVHGGRGLKSSILLPTTTYGSETWTWNRTHKSRVRPVEISYLRGACGVTRWEVESTEGVYERCSMGACKGVKCV